MLEDSYTGSTLLKSSRNTGGTWTKLSPYAALDVISYLDHVLEYILFHILSIWPLLRNDIY